MNNIFSPENMPDYEEIRSETEECIIEYYAEENNQSVENYISFLESSTTKNDFIYNPADGSKIHVLLIFYAKQNNMTYEDYMQPLESKAIG